MLYQKGEALFHRPGYGLLIPFNIKTRQMMKKLDFFGAGPRIGRVILPYFASAIALTIIFPRLFTFGEPVRNYLLIIGIILLALGLILYGLTVRLLLKGLKEIRLVTNGTYRYCQNPLYAIIILLIIPGIGLIMNSWLIITTCIIGYIVFKKLIGMEYKEMTEMFGEEYLQYKKRTPEFFPFIR
jgi:protein-S-isoprenylcysteine O-methyltransferase Ste14